MKTIFGLLCEFLFVLGGLLLGFVVGVLATEGIPVMNDFTCVLSLPFSLTLTLTPLTLIAGGIGGIVIGGLFNALFNSLAKKNGNTTRQEFGELEVYLEMALIDETKKISRFVKFANDKVPLPDVHAFFSDPSNPRSFVLSGEDEVELKLAHQQPSPYEENSGQLMPLRVTLSKGGQTLYAFETVHKPRRHTSQNGQQVYCYYYLSFVGLDSPLDTLLIFKGHSSDMRKIFS